MKVCIEPSCKNNQFGGGYCKYHQWKRKQQGGDLFKRKAPIKKRSDKRAKDEKYYAKHCRELTEEIKSQNNGKIFCFFSNLEIMGMVTYHHLRGRTGKFYTDKEWLVPCLNNYHLDYHFKDTEWLKEQDWYTKTFLPNLKSKLEELWRKEIRKGEKVHRINPEKELFDEN